MSLEIFKNQTINASINVRGRHDGILQVDISGVLDGADVVTYILDNESVPIVVRDCSWLSSEEDLLNNGDASIKYLQNRILRFTVENAGASTDINFSISHSADNLEIIT